MYNPIPDSQFFLPVALFILGALISYGLSYVDYIQSWKNGFDQGVEQTLKVVNDDRIGDADMKPNQLLKECRKNKKLTIKELAEKSGVAPHTIMNIEAGRTNSRLDTFHLLFDAMDYEMTVIEKRYPHGRPDNKSRCR